MRAPKAPLDIWDAKHAKLTPWECLLVQPVIAALAVIFIALIVGGVLFHWLGLSAFGAVLALFEVFAVAVEGPGLWKNARRNRLIASRPTRWRKRRVIAVPHGDYVTVYGLKRTGGRYSAPELSSRRFHAENDAEAAYEYAASLREETSEDAQSDEARSLAAALNMSGR